MRELRAWSILVWRLTRYLFYRLGVGSCPTLLDVYPELVIVFDRIMGWPKRLRIAGKEHCPPLGPVVFSGNHYAKDDPFVAYRAIHRACGGGYPVHYMMRDDFFVGAGGILKSKLVDVDELVRMLGALQISRDRVQLSQLKPFVALLREQSAFIMYPGRSRTRTGVFVEYRDGIDEPGGVTFLVAQAQRNRPDIQVAIVPFARTSNLATGTSVVAFGQSVALPHDADRAAQRDLDFQLIERMGDLVEINATHIVAGILYLHCLHGRTGPLNVDRIDKAVESAFARLPNRHIDPAARTDHGNAVRAALTFFARGAQDGGFVRLTGSEVFCNTEAVLASPPHDTTYRKANPIKYSINQVLHLPDVIDAMEHAALACGAR
jgi:hypothetical protein